VSFTGRGGYMMSPYFKKKRKEKKRKEKKRKEKKRKEKKRKEKKQFWGVKLDQHLKLMNIFNNINKDMTITINENILQKS
jgi:ATP adenylyltransferase/5',5'''-P-1,P-4-tetraphosphate phosphorylase II